MGRIFFLFCLFTCCVHYYYYYYHHHLNWFWLTRTFRRPIFILAVDCGYLTVASSLTRQCWMSWRVLFCRTSWVTSFIPLTGYEIRARCRRSTLRDDSIPLVGNHWEVCCSRHFHSPICVGFFFFSSVTQGRFEHSNGFFNRLIVAAFRFVFRCLSNVVLHIAAPTHGPSFLSTVFTLFYWLWIKFLKF